MPLGNYLVWPRRCPACHARRTWRTWLVEVITIGATISLWLFPPHRLGFVIGLVLLLFFGLVAIIDLEYRLILHPVSIGGAILGAGIGIWTHGLSRTVIGGLAGFGCMLMFYYLGGLFARWVARRRGETLEEEALGFGDVSLSGVLGLVLGWPGILGGLVLGIMIGGLISLIYLLLMLVTHRYRIFAAIPYGPSLIASAIILLYFVSNKTG